MRRTPEVTESKTGLPDAKFVATIQASRWLKVAKSGMVNDPFFAAKRSFGVARRNYIRYSEF
jgi:hypothetical protein